MLTAIWLALATYLELPVSSQQSIQCAFLGTILVTEGFSYITIWNKVTRKKGKEEKNQFIDKIQCAKDCTKLTEKKKKVQMLID